MGWLFTSKSRPDLIHELTRPSACEKGTLTTLAYAVNDDESVLWSVAELRCIPKQGDVKSVPKSQRFIHCYLLECHGGQWGYKPLDESMHPYRYSCPLAFLEMVPVSCLAWRQKVMEYHTRE